MSGQASSESSLKIPRDKDDDYRESVADARRRFVTERTGAELNHVAKYSIDPSIGASLLWVGWFGTPYDGAARAEGLMLCGRGAEVCSCPGSAPVRQN
jgi:hypothetical protein